MVVCLSENAGETQLIGLAEHFRFETVTPETARELLHGLIEKYATGQNLPLPWFNQTMYKWLLKDPEQDADKAWREAEIHFYGGFRNRPRAESDDAYIARIYPDLDKVQTEFETLAKQLMEPALDHRQKVEE